MRQALILAGGKGTRLASRLNGAPKPLVKIDGTPLLERQLSLLSKHGFGHVLLLANHRADALEEFCADFSSPGMRIDVVQDSKGARGTAGAVYDALPLLEATFLVLYGDTLLDIDLTRFGQAHQRANQKFGALATLFLHPNNHPYDSDLVEVDEEDRIRAFYAKPHQSGAFHGNLVNAALYVLDRQLIGRVPAGDGIVDFGRDLFPQALEAGAPLAGYSTYEYIKDVGTPDRLDQAEADLRSGKVARCALSLPQKAVFLDRDGTLNRPAGHISSPEALELIDGAAPAVARLNHAEYRCVLVTNQPVLARGECSAEQLYRIHGKLATLLGRSGGFLDAIYVCPHHPENGFVGEVIELKIPCDCRKPKAGLLLKAKADLSIDLTRSWMVGDSAADIGAARAAGVRSILVRTGGAVSTMLDEEPDYELDDLSSAADFIVSGHAALAELVAPIAESLVAGALVRIAGQSRRGKSVVASLLRELLIERALDAVHVRLDRWLIRHQQRPAGSDPHARFDWKRLHWQLGPWAAGSPLWTRLPTYDPHGGADRAGPRLALSKEGIMIVDGTFAFDFAPASKRQTINIFVDGPEKLRAERFAQEYTRRGLSAAAIEELYRQRLDEEAPMIESTRQQADLVLVPPPHPNGR